MIIVKLFIKILIFIIYCFQEFIIFFKYFIIILSFNKLIILFLINKMKTLLKFNHFKFTTNNINPACTHTFHLNFKIMILKYHQNFNYIN
jgi:hypothetical protein